MKIDIEVIGTFCNNWPNLIVEINNKKVYDSKVKNKETITLEFEDLITKGNKFVIGMVNKRFGRNSIWDTKSENNKIIEDQTIRIVSLKLNDVECKQLFSDKFYVKRTDRQPSYFPDILESQDIMNYNGYFSFDFDLPLYNSLINKKFKVKADNNISYFSNYTKVFHYEEEKKMISSINDILKEVDEKFGDKRTKIRNT